MPPERPMTRSPWLGDQLDPDLVGVDRSLGERMADAERPDDGLDEVLPARLERRDLGPERAEELAVDRSSLAEGEEVDADLLVLEELLAAPRPIVVIALRIAARPVLAPRNRWLWICRAPLPSKSLAPKSFEAFRSMWHSAQFALATGG